jgi:hypothetical protein
MVARLHGAQAGVQARHIVGADGSQHASSASAANSSRWPGARDGTLWPVSRLSVAFKPSSQLHERHDAGDFDLRAQDKLAPSVRGGLGRHSGRRKTCASSTVTGPIERSMCASAHLPGID